MVMTTRETLKQAEIKLKRAGIKTARLDTVILLEKATGESRSYLLANPESKLNPRWWKRFNALVTRRARHEPIAYLVGYKEFYGIDFAVTRDVLIPRPETETLVDLAIELTAWNGSLIDVGTGSGCIAIAIAKHRSDLTITATDLSFPALKIAKINAARNRLNDRLIYHQSDLFDQVKWKFDTVVANLPYLKDGYFNADSPLGYEPPRALAGGSDGLELYRRFFKAAPKHLKPNGYVIIETEQKQQRSLVKIAKVNGYSRKKTQAFTMAFTDKKNA